MSPKRVTLRFRAALEYRPLAIELVTAVVRQVEQAESDFVHELVTAFGEAFNNIVIHGYRDIADGMLDIEADIEDGAIRLRLIDSGRAVDFADCVEPDLAALPESGMGVFMMHALVDEVLYSEGSPNVLSLVKRTSPRTEAPE